MAADFFLLSKSYVDYVSNSKRGAGSDILRRRAIIVKYLNDSYLSGEKDNVVKNIEPELEAAGIVTTKASIGKDMESYRIAYLYYQSQDKEQFQQKIAKGNQSAKGLEFLLKDGFDSWEKIVSALKFSEVETIEDVEMDIVVQKSERDIVLEGHFSVINEYVNDLKGKIVLLEKMLRGCDEVLLQKDEVVAGLQSELDTANELVAMGDEEIKRLQTQLSENKDLLARSADVQEALRDIQDLAASVLPRENKSTESMAIIGKALDDSNGKAEELSCEQKKDFFKNDLLPTDCKYLGKKFIYEKDFSKYFKHLDEKTTRIVIKAVENFSEYGPNYRALNTAKHIGQSTRVDIGDMKSRAGRNLRFTWGVTGDAVIIYDLFTKENC